MKRLAILFLALTLGSNVLARELDFVTAFSLALENNKEILLQEVAQRKAELGDIKARAIMMPSLTANLGYQQREHGFLQNSSSTTSPNDSYNTRYLNASLSQPIYTGGRAAAERSKATHVQVASAYQVTAAQKSIYLALVSLFADIRQAEAIAAVNRANIERLEEHLSKSRIRFEVGEVEKTVLLQSEMALSQGRADYQASLNTLHLLEVRLGNIVGIASDITLVGEIPQPATLPETIDDLLRLANEHRDDLKAEQAMLDFTNEDLRVQVSKYLPTVRAGVDYRNNTIDGVGQRAGTSEGDDITFMLNLELPIFEGGTRVADYREAKYNIIERSHRILQLKEQIRFDVHQSVYTLDTLSHRLREAQSRITLAEENLRMVRLQFEVGEATNLDLLDAIVNLKNSELDLVINEFDQRKNQFILMQAIGTIGAELIP
ncbi:TolC family protein [Chrysiogenes arsenatis]|uniref:TolC family protein n=1 Tax=Chrysiogenes arsenatis TaxID=309797 RepID=UPI000403651D|nr:TolC family protein [Chrysiogenes arsenatis]